MRARLRTRTPTSKPARVDRSGHGAILGASLMSKGEAVGHGFWIDDETISQAVKLSEGSSGRWTHGDMCADGLGTHLGRWKNIRREGDAAVGDFHFSPLAKNVRPSGLSVDAPTYLMDAAEKEPEVVGVSAVIDYELVDAPDADDGETRKLARLKRVPRADYVADPAANPDGLFAGTPSELAERYATALSEATEAHGRERVESFLRAYLGHAQTQIKEPTVDIEALKKKHGEELAAKDAQIAALNATVKEFTDAKAKREAEEIEAYVASLKKDAAPNAIEEPKLEHVRSLLKAGMGDSARALGSALLAAIKLGARGEVITLGPGSDEAAQQRTAHMAAQLRAAGWTVEVSADGTEITKKTPPGGGR